MAPQELIERIGGLRAELEHLGADRIQRTASVVEALGGLLANGNVKPWLDLPETLYALARFHADAGATAKARQYYEKAIAIEDVEGHVPVSAIEQLANLEARQGARDEDRALIDTAITRLLALVQAAAGTEPPAVNAERCAILGSAYKRLASVLTEWSGEDQDKPAAIAPALKKSIYWYGRGAGTPDGPQYSPYNALNRLALAAVLGAARPGDDAHAQRAGELAAARYRDTLDYFNLVMSAGAELTRRLIDGSLWGPQAEETERDIIDRYREVRAQLPENERRLDSVRAQLELLAQFLEAKTRAEAPAATAAPAVPVAERLRRIAKALDATGDRGPVPATADAPESPAAEPPAEPSAPSAQVDEAADPEADHPAPTRKKGSRKPPSK